jgi:DNA-binding GntR family transcriptional regulator
MSIAHQLPDPLSDRQSLPQLIADALRGTIICGRLMPGQPLRRAFLAEHFSASRSDDEHAALCRACRDEDLEGACGILELHLLKTGELLAGCPR